jgi:protein-S-isoprenylcysteine O-methyltransferase Ste14
MTQASRGSFVFKTTCRNSIYVTLPPNYGVCEGDASKISTRHKIIGVELVGLGVFLLLLVVLELFQTVWNQTVQSFAWVFAIIGAAIILVGFEVLSRAGRFPASASKAST